MKYKGSVLIAFAVLLLFLVSFFIPSLKMDSSENRTMATFGMVFHPEEDSVVYHSSPVERLDAALSDQFPFREFFVKKYLWFFNQSENCTARLTKKLKLEKPQATLHAVGNYELIGETGYLTVYPGTEPMDSSIVQQHVDQMEHLHQLYPDLQFYVYYVSQAYDADWIEDFCGTKPADHYQEIVDAIPEYVKSDHLVYHDLDEYMDLHYMTDHHWNHRGARRGYEDIYAMMRNDMGLGEIRTPNAEIAVSEMYDFDYLGSYGRALGELYSGYDEFSFYDYPLPERKLAILDLDSLTETEVVKIGLYDEYQNGEINKSIGTDHYIAMYGTAKDAQGDTYSDSSCPFIIRNSRGNGKNLMICGDSYSRAIRDPLASHYDTTVYLDYRTLADIPIDHVIETYDIDVLLICSNTSMWDSAQYLFTFREDK